MDIKTKLCTLWVMILFISCHKDKTPEKSLPVLREGIYGLYLNENTSEHFEDYFYIKYNKIYLTKSVGPFLPACLYRVCGIIKLNNDSTTESSEIYTGDDTTTDSCEFDNDIYGGNYGIFYLSKGKIEQFGSKVNSVSGTFTFDFPRYHEFGTYRLVFLNAYPK